VNFKPIIDKAEILFWLFVLHAMKLQDKVEEPDSSNLNLLNLKSSKLPNEAILS